MDWLTFIHESIFGSLGVIKKVACVIFPLFVVIEIIDHYGILEKISSLFKKLLIFFNLPKEASLPIIIGQSVGLLFGAGLILRSTQENKFTPGELMSISVLFATCHAVFEDTLLFVAIGGKGFIILGSRIILAILVTFIYGRYRIKRQNRSISG